MSMFADNPDFYPTPKRIAELMLSKVTDKEAKYFLEPSAGKGDIADVIKQTDYYGSPRCHVDVIENYPDLIQVLRGKEYDVVGSDWLTYQGVSYYDVIVMNPPFSNGAAHLLKAWEFLHNGEIVCLLNEETIKNPFSDERKRLAAIIEEFGSVEYLGDCFSTAEHKTNVNVALVHLTKTAPDDTPDLWAQTPTQEKEHTTEFDGDPTMLAIRDNLGNMEHWFNMANEHWMKGISHIRKAKFFMDQNKISDHNSSSNRDEDFQTILKMSLSNVQTCRAEFLRRHRRLAWTSVFCQMEFNKWLDSKQQDVFMRDVERDSTIPFTADNIRSTLENVFMSRKRLFEESVANVFDALCSHAVENGEGPEIPGRLKNSYRRGEGWKTNDTYKVNQKLIFPYGVEYRYGVFSTPWSGDARTLYSDIDRILCVLDNQPFDQCYTVGQALDNRCRQVGSRTCSGGWTFESQYFEGRFFKKGTVHLKWKRIDLWEAFNKTAAAGKRWLGENTQQYRPTKRKNEDYYCQRNGHEFANGICQRCGDPEFDEIAAVECDYCRAIFEHTGRKHCPIHEEPIPTFAPQAQMELLG